MTGAPGSTLEAAWNDQSRWSQAADRAKREYMRWQAVGLALMIAAAVATTLAGQLPADFSSLKRGLAFAAAAMVAILALVGRNKTSPDRMREWIRARSASEGIKSEIYLYLTRSSHYRKPEPRKTFDERLAAITNAMRDLNHAIADVVPRSKPLPQSPLSAADYFAQRVDSQIEQYYRTKAASEARLVRTFRSLEFSLAVIATGIGVWAGVDEKTAFAPWGAVVTTVIAALAAHLAAGRHEYQVMTYMATALELQRLSTRFKDETREGTLSAEAADELVTQCEAAISVENQGWMAQWQKPAA